MFVSFSKAFVEEEKETMERKVFAREKK